MSPRLLVLGALVALAAACGSGEGSEDASDTTTPGDGPVEGLALAVDGVEGLVAGGPVTWRLTVTNVTPGDAAMIFTTGQQGEVVLLAEGDEEVYRWSEGMVFAQLLNAVPLAAGAAVTFELTGTLDVAPGQYVLEASIPSKPTPAPVRLDVTVAG